MILIQAVAQLARIVLEWCERKADTCERPIIELVRESWHV
jgi:hypothetical protein